MIVLKVLRNECTAKLEFGFPELQLRRTETGFVMLCLL